MCGGIYQGSNTTFTIIGGVWLLVIEWCHTIQEWNETCIYLTIEGIAGPDSFLRFSLQTGRCHLKHVPNLVEAEFKLLSLLWSHN